MRKLYFLILSIIFMVSAAALLPAEPISLAVTQIVPIGVDGDTARLTEELLQTEFSKSPVFRLVERSRLDEILEEQKLSLSGITDTDSAIQAGNILNVDRVVFGSLGRYESEYIDYLLSLRLVDVEHATVEAAESIQIKKGADLQKTISKIVSRLQGKLEFTGEITVLEGNAVYTSLGEGMGIRPADVLGVFKTDLIKDDTGAVIMREETSVANLVVEQVSPEGSKCRILDSAGELSKGLPVRQGRIELQKTGTGGRLAIETIPEGAKVFLGKEFIGVTPLTLEQLEPDEYSVAIRSGGYKSYSETINVSAGKTAKLDVELEEEISTEELLLLGKAPREKTAPGTAAKKALLPGAGHIYNGYESAGLIIPAGIVLNFAFGGLMTSNYLNAKNELEEFTDLTISGLSYWDRREYYQTQTEASTALISAVMMGGSSLYSYLYSILDAGMTARSDFLYPTFVEIFIGGNGMFTSMTQTGDSNINLDADFEETVTGGVSSLYGGGHVDIIYRGKKFYASLGLIFTLHPIAVDYRIAYRFQLGDSVFIGPGVSVYAQIKEPESWTDPMVKEVYAPILSFSYFGYSLELDVNVAPIALGNASVFVFEQGASHPWNSYVPGVYSSMAELAVNWFFSTRTGVRLHSRYYYAWNRQTELEKQGFTGVGSLHHLTASVGMVFRF